MKRKARRMKVITTPILPRLHHTKRPSRPTSATPVLRTTSSSHPSEILLRVSPHPSHQQRHLELSLRQYPRSLCRLLLSRRCGDLSTLPGQHHRRHRRPKKARRHNRHRFPLLVTSTICTATMRRRRDTRDTTRRQRSRRRPISPQPRASLRRTAGHRRQLPVDAAVAQGNPSMSVGRA